jgi:epoxyqueuosine reductase QueG
MDLSGRLQALLKSEGASLVGFADLGEIPSDNRDNFPLGVSIGVALSPKIISDINEGPTYAYIEECLRLDSVLDGLGQLTAEFLTTNGYKAKRQATTNTAGSEYPPNLTTKLPHKNVATRAGLGWIGKNAILVTKEFGSAVRLGSILTDADLSVGTPINVSRCGECTACVKICPAQAILGNNWKVGVLRDSLLNAVICRKTARKRLIKRIGSEVVGRTFCGMCIAACPWTKSYLEKSVEALF